MVPTAQPVLRGALEGLPPLLAKTFQAVLVVTGAPQEMPAAELGMEVNRVTEQSYISGVPRLLGQTLAPAAMPETPAPQAAHQLALAVAVRDRQIMPLVYQAGRRAEVPGETWARRVATVRLVGLVEAVVEARQATASMAEEAAAEGEVLQAILAPPGILVLQHLRQPPSTLCRL